MPLLDQGGRLALNLDANTHHMIKLFQVKSQKIQWHKQLAKISTCSWSIFSFGFARVKTDECGVELLSDGSLLFSSGILPSAAYIVDKSLPCLTSNWMIIRGICSQLMSDEYPFCIWMDQNLNTDYFWLLAPHGFRDRSFRYEHHTQPYSSLKRVNFSYFVSTESVYMYMWRWKQ